MELHLSVPAHWVRKFSFAFQYSTWFTKIFVTVAFLIFACTRILDLHNPLLNIDEASYAADAVRSLTRGSLALTDIRDTKPPEIYVLYKSAFFLGGNYDMVAVRVLSSLWVLMTSVLIFFLGRIALSNCCGLYACGFYLLATSVDRHFAAFKTELAMNLPLAAAFLLLILGAEKRSAITLGLAGIAGGLAALCKQPAGIVLVGPVLGLLLYASSSGAETGLMWVSRGVALFAAGFALPFLVVAGLYWSHGALFEFMQQVFYLPAQFSSALRYTLAQRFLRTFTYLEEYTRYSPFLFYPSFIGWWSLFLSDGRDKDEGIINRIVLLRYILPLSLASSLLAFLAAPDLYQAYFVMLFVPLSLSFGCLASFLFEAENWRRSSAHARVAIMGCATLGLLAAAILSLKDPIKGYQNILNRERDAVVRSLRASAATSDELLVWGYQPDLYLFSGLVPATRFTLTDVLIGLSGTVGRHPEEDAEGLFAEKQGWTKFMADLDRERPKFIFDHGHMANFTGQYPLTLFPRLADFVNKYYDKVEFHEPTLFGGVLYQRRPS